MSRAQGAIVAIIVLVVGAMSVSACGGDDDDEKTSATVTGGQSPTAASTTAAGGTTPAATGAATTAPTTAGATEPPDGGGGASEACALLTNAEVEAAFGEAILEPVPGEAIDTPMSNGATASVTTCGYTSESFASSISVTFWSAPDHEDGIQDMIQLACSGKEMISGLGDSACWYDQQHVQIQLSKDGGFVDMFATTSLNAGDILMDLMEKAAGRI